jgi:hypothetical protein
MQVVWGFDPYSWAVTQLARTSPVTTVNLFAASTGAPLHAADLVTHPAVLSLSVSAAVDTAGFACSHWSAGAGDWVSDGEVLLGFDAVDGGGVVALCASTHCTDFAGSAGVAPVAGVGRAPAVGMASDGERRRWPSPAKFVPAPTAEPGRHMASTA